MSNLLLGTVSGALAASGVYYGFSNLITTRTVQLRVEMHSLSQSLSGAESIVPAPPSAAARIDRSTFGSLVHDSWNRQTASVIESILSFDAMTLPEKAKKAWNGKQS